MQEMGKTLDVMSSIATREAYLELVPRFEQESRVEVKTSWVGGAEIAKRLHAGATPDLVIMASAAIDDLVKEGLLAAGSRVDLASSVIGVAIAPGAPRPDLSSEESLRAAVMQAPKVAYSSGPSGVYLAGVFERWGVPREKLIQTAPGQPAGEVAARGEAQLAFQQVSELLPVKGIEFVGPIPAQMQLVTIFSAGMHAGARNAPGARALTRFITSPDAAPTLRRHGLEPAAPKR
jgi:molybdate transport system substrate-binding protein